MSAAHRVVDLLNPNELGASDRIRSATLAAHAAVERVPMLAELATGSITDADYARAIAGFAQLFRAIIGRISEIPGGPPLLALTDAGARTARAEADAVALGRLDSGPRLSVIFVHDHASALGALYTLEGSRMGGALIGARLHAMGRQIGSPGHTFFDLRGVPVAEHWRAFKTRLDQRITTAAELNHAVLAARGAFGLTATLLDGL